MLAGEANAPGTYSKRTANFISDLDKAEANLFTQFCGFVAQTTMSLEPVPLVFDEGAKIYETQGIDFMRLQHLESIGLIKFAPSLGFNLRDLPKRVVFIYGGRSLGFEMEKATNNTLEIEKTLLTRIGMELLPICGAKSVEGFFEYLEDRWEQFLPKAEAKESATCSEPGYSRGPDLDMAIYNLTVSSGSRAGGASAVGKLDYLTCESKYHCESEDLHEAESGWRAIQPNELHREWSLRSVPRG